MPGVYISFPFCAQKCSFCNFASGVFSRDTETLYYNALLCEIAAQAWAWTPDTVYLGGGTPSNMELPELARVLATIPGGPGRKQRWKRAGYDHVLEGGKFGGARASIASAWESNRSTRSNWRKQDAVIPPKR